MRNSIFCQRIRKFTKRHINDMAQEVALCSSFFHVPEDPSCNLTFSAGMFSKCIIARQTAVRSLPLCALAGI